MSRLARLASFLPLVLLAVSCERQPPGYEGPYQRQVRKAIPALEESSGLVWKTLPVLQERSKDEVREFLTKQFNEQMTPVELAGAQQAYRLFGLLPDTLDLRTFFIDLLTEQIAGYYDPATRVLYIVKDAPADIRDITITHELMHALQHQYAPLDSVQSLKGDNDRMVAMQSVIEGQATYEQLIQLSGGNDLAMNLPGNWDQIRESIRDGQSTMPRFAKAPALIQETLLFPYLSGAEFIRQFKRQRNGQQPYSPFPASTEQVMHPERYLTATPDLPTRVTLAAPRSGSLVHEDNLGEFETLVMLYELTKDQGGAKAAADGWDGDRYQVIQTAAGPALAWATVWDSPVEAAQFGEVMRRAIEKRYGIQRQAGDTGFEEERQWTAKGRRLRLADGVIGGKNVVLYEDAPDGAPARLLPLDRITLKEP